MTKADLDPHRPGNGQNADRGPRGWLRFYAVLHRRHATLVETPDKSSSLDMDTTLVQALQATPVAVLETKGSVAGAHKLAAYPKSFEALMQMQKRDDLIGWLALRYAFLHDSPSAEADRLEFLQRITDELTYQYQVLTWMVTTPGPGLPFSWEEASPEVPPAIRALDTFDLLEVVRAHVQVNALRLRALRTMMTPDKSSTERDRPTWAMFFANAGMELKRAPRELMRDYSLVEVLAMIQLHSVSNKDAYADATKEKTA